VGKQSLFAVRTPYYEEEREVGSSEIHYGWGEQNMSSVLKVPRHCPFVLLVSVSFQPVLLKFNFFVGVEGGGVNGLR
jgi:hypothetical protein